MIIEYLSEFIYLARENSLSAAAKKLYLSQPTLSKHIAIMEKELGVRLLERDSHGITLTPEGVTAAQLFESVVNDYELAVKAISLNSKGYNRKLTFAFLEHLLDSELYDKTEKLKAMRSDYLISVVFKNASGIADGLHDGSIDVALQMNYRYRNDDKMNQRLVAKRPMRLAVRDNDPLCSLTSVTLKDIADRDLVLPSDAHGFEQSLNEWFVERGLSKPRVTHSSQRSTQLLTALQEKSIATVLAELPRSVPDKLKIIDLDEPGVTVDFFWIYRKSIEDRELKSFLNQASKIFGK